MGKWQAIVFVNTNKFHIRELPIQLYVITFVSNLRHICGFLRVLRFVIKQLIIVKNWQIVKKNEK
jgi:hypothetical protein